MSLSQKQIILTLVQGTEGSAWTKKLEEGWIDAYGDDDVCYWSGINCDAETETIVEGIRLPDSSFVGTIPSELGLLTSLK